MQSAPQPANRLYYTKTAMIFVAVSALAFVEIFFLLLFSREPEYKGKPVSYWLKEIDHARNAEAAIEATEAIQAMYKHALPFLLKELGYESRLKKRLRSLLQNQGFFKIEPKQSRKHLPAIFAFSLLKDKAVPAIPPLVELAEEGENGALATFSLFCIGSKAIPALEQICASTNFDAATAAIEFRMRLNLAKPGRLIWYWNGTNLLANFYPNPIDELDEMSKFLTSENEALRHACVNWFRKQLAHGIPYSSNQLRSAIIAINPKIAPDAGFE